MDDEIRFKFKLATVVGLLVLAAAMGCFVLYLMLNNKLFLQISIFNHFVLFAILNYRSHLKPRYYRTKP